MMADGENTHLITDGNWNQKGIYQSIPEQLSKCKLESLLTLCGVAALFHAMVSLIKLLCHLSSKSLKGIFFRNQVLNRQVRFYITCAYPEAGRNAVLVSGSCFGFRDCNASRLLVMDQFFS